MERAVNPGGPAAMKVELAAAPLIGNILLTEIAIIIMATCEIHIEFRDKSVSL
jgi:hypothetical protein